jgi:hypothetical protein
MRWVVCLCAANAGKQCSAIGHAKFYSGSHFAVIRVYGEAGNVIETHEQAGDRIPAKPKRARLRSRGRLTQYLCGLPLPGSVAKNFP